MDFKELENLIKGRRSIRLWQEKDVDEKLIMQAIELATYAPNAGNQQNWKFYVVKNRSTIKALADANKTSAEYVASWPEVTKFGDTAANMVKKADFFGKAPVIIAVAAAQYSSPVEQMVALREANDPKARLIHDWRDTANSRIQSVSSAIAYLVLILHQMGLGSVWMTGPMQAKGEIEKILKVPQGLDIVALIPAGYPAEAPPLKERKPVSVVCEVIK